MKEISRRWHDERRVLNIALVILVKQEFILEKVEGRNRYLKKTAFTNQ